MHNVLLLREQEEGLWELSALSAQFSYKCKTVLKYKI
jgi:hypothetical protein